MRRRDFIGLLAASAAWPRAAAAQGADYPTRLIKLMHGFPPGGNVDVVARLMAQEMAKSLGQTIVVEGKPGIAGNLAAEALAGDEQQRVAVRLGARQGLGREVAGDTRLALDHDGLSDNVGRKRRGQE